MKSKIGLGGSCHWCTEAIFQSLKGVTKVEQGWIGSTNENKILSEAVIVHFDAARISLATLIEIHLYTHSSTSNHSMREKYRSAVYCFDEEQIIESETIITVFQKNSYEKIITQVLPFVKFKENEINFLDYYYSNPEKPFCENVINPKLKLLREKFSKVVNEKKLQHFVVKFDINVT